MTLPGDLIPSIGLRADLAIDTQHTSLRYLCRVLAKLAFLADFGIFTTQFTENRASLHLDQEFDGAAPTLTLVLHFLDIS